MITYCSLYVTFQKVKEIKSVNNYWTHAREEYEIIKMQDHYLSGLMIDYEKLNKAH